MKNLLLLCFITVYTGFQVFAQEEKTNVEKDIIKSSDTSISVTEDGIQIRDKLGKEIVNISDKEIMIIEEGKDTTRIKIGNKGIEIIEGEDGKTTIDIKDLKKEEPKTESTKKAKFKGNWSGIELGLNNYLNKDFRPEQDPALKFMDLNTNRSFNLNLNILQYNIGFGAKKAGLVTGMGLEFSNYFFDGNNNIQKNSDGIIVEYVPSFLLEPGASVNKSKLATTYLTVPLLMEFQIPAGKHNVHISGGLIGGAKIGSSTKIVYKERGKRQKDKVKDDFNLSPLRYGYTVRAGYRNLNLFANYYPVSLFEKGKGPELYPYSVGLRLISF